MKKVTKEQRIVLTLVAVSMLAGAVVMGAVYAALLAWVTGAF